MEPPSTDADIPPDVPPDAPAMVARSNVPDRRLAPAANKLPSITTGAVEINEKLPAIFS